VVDVSTEEFVHRGKKGGGVVPPGKKEKKKGARYAKGERGQRGGRSRSGRKRERPTTRFKGGGRGGVCHLYILKEKGGGLDEKPVQGKGGGILSWRERRRNVGSKGPLGEFPRKKGSKKGVATAETRPGDARAEKGPKEKGR